MARRSAPSAFLQQSPAARYRAGVRLWIDTDVGDNPDDSVALLLARVHPDVDLAGVSVVGTEPGARARLARELVGDEPLPVVDGDDLARLAEAPADGVVAIGPLTNLRSAEVEAPVTIMGGALRTVRHRGRVRRVESNFGADPAAARHVLRTWFCRIVPLDVTAQMVVTPDEAVALGEAHPALAGQLASWPHQLCLHDPLALLVALGDVAYDEDIDRLTVEADGRLRRGRGIEQRVVLDADVDAAKERILSLLLP